MEQKLTKVIETIKKLTELLTQLNELMVKITYILGLIHILTEFLN